jgi:hypothetical protein
LRNKDKQLLERTKAEIKGSISVDTGIDSPQPALPISSSPVPDLVTRQVSVQGTPFTDSRESRTRELLLLSEDALFSDTTSPVAPSLHARNESLREPQSPGETTSIQRGPIDASRKDPDVSPLTKDKPLPASPQSLHIQSHSPSIANLSRRSVVRKRLAEMQRHPTMSNSSSRNSDQLASPTVTTLLPHEPTSDSVKVDSGLADAGSHINSVGLSPTTEQSMSPGSSEVASSLGGSDFRLDSPVSVAPDPSTLPLRPKSAFRLRDEMRARDSEVVRHGASQRSVSSSAAAILIDSQADGTIDALLDVIDVHAERQLIKTAELNSQLEAVQNDVRDAAANVRVVVAGRERDFQQLAEIHTVVGDVRNTLANLDAKQRDNISVAASIDEGLRSNQTQIFQALEEIQEILRNSNNSNTVIGGQPSGFLRTSHDTEAEHADLSDIRHQLELLLELSTQGSNAAPLPTGPQFGSSQVRSIVTFQLAEYLTTMQDSIPPEHLGSGGQVAKPTSDQPHESTLHNTKASVRDSQTQNFMEVLPNDEERCMQLMEQQAESVRYLNELNTVRSAESCLDATFRTHRAIKWLETFVNGGTAQIAAIADDVQRLRKALGDIDELPGDTEGDTSAAGQTATSTLLQNMRMLTADSQRRKRDSAHLLSTMNGLVAALNEDMRKNAEMRSAYSKYNYKRQFSGLESDQRYPQLQSRY